ncbi:MAG: hypothetical protein J7604_01920 [Sporocytophaga sp.]|uniref:hypothetical protein n=1 Tax=Sporocytophaga sp. TaxID=2231183 RepID=UPI001B1CB6E2|nr:hypothetical protein [Sporocytophaga sp.]MBO9698932.1 hypothetical protein [Sporocytophaga sp.]
MKKTGNAFIMIPVLGFVLFLVLFNECEVHRIKGLPEVTGIITTETPIYATSQRIPCYALHVEVSYYCKSKKCNQYSDYYIFLADNLKMKIGQKYYPILIPKGYNDAILHKTEYYLPDMKEGEFIYYDRSDDIPTGLFGHDEKLDCLVKTKTCFSKNVEEIIIKESFCRLDRKVTLKGKIQGDFVVLIK